MLSNITNKNITDLDLWEKSLLFAELSAIAYKDIAGALNLSKQIGFSNANFFDHKGAQGYIFETKEDLVVSCRGTQPNKFSDIKADIKLWPTKSETFGHVHKGFKLEADKIWKGIKTQVVNGNKTTWFTGYSLGAAIATICVARCHHHAPSVSIGGLFTYGSPKVGLRTFVKSLNIKHYRWVNNADIVTMVPPAFMGYVHHGEIEYLNAWGNVREYTYWQRFKDRRRAIWKGLCNGSVDPFTDHHIMDYVKHIQKKITGKEYPQE